MKGGTSALLSLVAGKEKAGGGSSAMSAEDEADAGAAYSKGEEYGAGDASFDAFAAAMSKGDNAKAKAALKKYIKTCMSESTEEE